PGLSTSTSDFPAITIRPPKDFSGDITGITVTLRAVDTDDDTDLEDFTDKPGVKTSTVTLNLYVNPVAGDITTSSNHTIQEDNSVAILPRIKVTDESWDETGGEIITEVSFTIPTDANG